ncbi:amidohydrolase family protein [Robiginitalea sp. SC105]|nr:amidohydrolase family protein [Robiginitalea sp. SC105]
MLGEISNQYEGIAPSDSRMHPYYALAEELNIPIAIHMGSGLPGHFYFEPKMTPLLSNPLELEPIIRKFPKLRISVMHYGEPFIDELIAMMGNFPQIYADIGGIQVYYPREYFYEYHLKKLVSAGFGKHIMFGSDMILFPELLGRAIEVINEAPFLSMEQKEDIFYNNAARFLNLDAK